MLTLKFPIKTKTIYSWYGEKQKRPTPASFVGAWQLAETLEDLLEHFTAGGCTPYTIGGLKARATQMRKMGICLKSLPERADLEADITYLQRLARELAPAA